MFECRSFFSINIDKNCYKGYCLENFDSCKLSSTQPPPPTFDEEVTTSTKNPPTTQKPSIVPPRFIIDLDNVDSLPSSTSKTFEETTTTFRPPTTTTSKPPVEVISTTVSTRKPPTQTTTTFKPPASTTTKKPTPPQRKPPAKRARPNMPTTTQRPPSTTSSTTQKPPAAPPVFVIDTTEDINDVINVLPPSTKQNLPVEKPKTIEENPNDTHKPSEIFTTTLPPPGLMVETNNYDENTFNSQPTTTSKPPLKPTTIDYIDAAASTTNTTRTSAALFIFFVGVWETIKIEFNKLNPVLGYFIITVMVGVFVGGSIISFCGCLFRKKPHLKLINYNNMTSVGTQTDDTDPILRENHIQDITPADIPCWQKFKNHLALFCCMPLWYRLYNHCAYIKQRIKLNYDDRVVRRNENQTREWIASRYSRARESVDLINQERQNEPKTSTLFSHIQRRTTERDLEEQNVGFRYDARTSSFFSQLRRRTLERDPEEQHRVASLARDLNQRKMDTATDNYTPPKNKIYNFFKNTKQKNDNDIVCIEEDSKSVQPSFGQRRNSLFKRIKYRAPPIRDLPTHDRTWARTDLTSFGGQLSVSTMAPFEDIDLNHGSTSYENPDNQITTSVLIHEPPPPSPSPPPPPPTPSPPPPPKNDTSPETWI